MPEANFQNAMTGFNPQKIESYMVFRAGLMRHDSRNHTAHPAGRTTPLACDELRTPHCFASWGGCTPADIRPIGRLQYR
jgi:hypothetical protein